MSKPFKIFIAYARQDAALLDELRKHLRPLERTGKVKIWYDGLIEPGAVWEEDIKAQLHNAELILLLLSADAIHSDYFYEKEMAEALARHERGEARVAPLILRPCVWKTTPLKALQALPKDGKPVTTWHDRDAAWSDAVESLWHFVQARERQIEEEKQGQEAARLQQASIEKARLEALAEQQRQAEQQKRLEEQKRQQAAAEAARRLKEQVEASTRQSQLDAQRRQRAEVERLQQAAAAQQRQQRMAAIGRRLRSPWAWTSVLVMLIMLFINKYVHTGNGASIPFSDPFENEMISIAGGTFQMGSDEYGDEQPIHEVAVASFSLSRYEVTQAQWLAVMGENPSHFENCDNCPVERVSWDEVQTFIQKLNQLTGKNYRLPSESEWEFAARGGSKSEGYRYAGSNDIDEVAWYVSNSGSKTQPVGGKKANELGLHDMSGNVWEWCADAWHDNYDGAPGDGSAWTSGGDQSRRVVRGGSWYDASVYCRATVRARDLEYSRDSSIGFRLAR